MKMRDYFRTLTRALAPTSLPILLLMLLAASQPAAYAAPTVASQPASKTGMAPAAPHLTVPKHRALTSPPISVSDLGTTGGGLTREQTSQDDPAVSLVQPAAAPPAAGHGSQSAPQHLVSHTPPAQPRSRTGASAMDSGPAGLPAPTNLTATPDNGQITLNWTASAGAAYYEIYESNSPNAPPASYADIGTSYSTTFTQQGLTNGTTYSYYVVAYNNTSVSTHSNTATATIGLPAPTGVSAAPGNGQATVTWSASTGSGVTSYNVFGSGSLNGAYTNLGNVPAGTLTYTQNGLSNGSTYYYYIVAHNNGGDSPHSTVASTTVVLPPPTGLTATLGNGSVTLNWTPSAAPGAAFYNVYESTNPNSGFTQLGTAYGSSFIQSGLSNAATYYFYLVPVNNGGVGTQSATVSATLGLAAPTGVAATPGNGQVTVTWNASTGNGVASYNVYESTSAGGPYANVGYVPASNAATFSFTQSGLSNGTTYYYYVVANNNGSVSPHSATVSALVSLPPPTGLSATTSGNTVSLTWTASAAPGASYYQVYQSSTANPTPASFAYIGTTAGTNYTQGGLAPGTTYTYYVVPVNSGGVGTPSAYATAPAVTSVATTLTATPGAGSITLNWTDHADSYDIYRSTDGSYFPYQGNTTATTYTQNGLSNGTTYYYYYVPHTGGNTGPQSPTVSALVQLPPPTNITATTGAGQITLNWTASAFPYATSYDVYRSTDGSYFPYQGNVTGTSYVDKGLSNGTTYYYYLVPKNSGGAGTRSATTAATAPGLPPPTNLSATTGAGSITLTWTASAYPGADSYDVYRSTDGSYFPYQGNTTATTYTQTGLSNGTTYYYYLVPKNAGGSGTQSATVSAQVGLPAPTNLTAVTGDGSITLNWTASAAPGATGYHVYRSTDGNYFPYQGDTANTNYVQTGLQNGVTYYYYVVPFNSGGTGTQSATVSAQVILPAPTDLTAKAGDGSITVTWNASAFPGATSYNVYRSTDGSYFPYQGNTTSTTYTQGSLQNGVTYYYYVVPYNDGSGPGMQSATVSAQVNLPPPTGLTATLGGGQVTLNWTASAFPGATSYNVYRSTDNSYFPYQGNTTATTYTQNGLNNGTTYYYFLVPYNSGGAGTQSATVSALVGLPPPTNLVATPGEGQITLTWTASAAPGADSYNVYRSTDGSYFPYQGNVTGTSYVDKGLTDGVTYYYYLVPKNAGSVGTQSATVSATPGLAAPTNLTATPGATSITLNWTAPTTPGLTGYNVYRATSLNGSYTLIGSPTATTYIDTNLPGGTTYYYYVTAYKSGNESPPSNKASATTTAPDVTPPTTSLTGGPADGSMACSSTVTFTFTGTDNRTPTAGLLYKYSIDGGAYTTPSAATTATFSSLADGAHVFTVKAIDQAGNVDPNGATSHFTVDTVAPVISNVTAVLITASGAHITWTTDKPATSQVDYRVQGTTTWTSTALDTAFVTSHDEQITGLSLAQTYEFRVRSADGCSNTTVSPVQTFTTTPDTTPPTTQITGGPADNGTVCQNTVTFTFTGTDNVTPTSGLKYEYAIDGGAFSAPSANTTTTLSGLTAGAHKFTVKAVDGAGNVDPNGVTVHFTVDLAAPVVSKVGTAPLDVRATISWATDIPSSSQVDFGPTNAYGHSTPLDPTLTTAHVVVVSGLSPSTTYHFRVRSQDACREGDGPDGTFSTTVPLLPNLEVTALSFTSPAKAGDTLSVSWNVTNVGPGDVNGQWSDTLYLSASSVIDANSIALGAYPAPNALQGGQFYSQAHSITLPTPLPAGTYYLLVQTDSGNAIKETSKSDNTLAQRLDITKVQTLLVTPDQNPISLVVNTPVSGTLNLSNVSAVGKTGIKATVVGAPANVQVQVVPPTALAAMSGDTAQITVTATDDSVLNSSPVVHFTDDQGDDTTATLNITVAPHRPNLVADPGSISVGMVRGRQTIVTVNVTNTGSAAANGLTVAVPQAPWLSLTTPQSIGTLAPGQTAQIVVTLMPDASLPLGLYNGTVGVNGSNTSLLINATFNCISDAKGSLKVTATDELTYFADNHPPLVGAQITVTDSITNAVVAQGVSGPDGTFSQTGIPEGTYNIQTTDAKHGTDQSQLTITAAQETDYTAFLPGQYVTYSWTVEPIGVTDQYQIVLQADFETHVPAPVVTVSPTVLDATTLSYDQNNQATVYFTVTNHGLIAGDDTHLELPTDPNYKFEAATTDLGSLPALSTIVIPVVVTRLSTAGGSASGSAKPSAIGFNTTVGPDGRIVAHGMAGGGGGGGCTTAAVVIYHYNCKGKRTGSATVNILVGNCGGYGVNNIPYNPGAGGGPGYLPTGGGPGGGGGGTLGFSGISVKIKHRCKPLPPCTLTDLENLAICLLGFVPIANCAPTIASNVAQCLAGIANAHYGGATEESAFIGCLLNGASAVAGCGLKTLSYPVGALVNIVSCYESLSPCDPFGNFGGGGSGPGGSGPPGSPGNPPIVSGPPGDPSDDAVVAHANAVRQTAVGQAAPQAVGARALDTTTTGSDGDNPFAANSPYFLNLQKQGARAVATANFLADSLFGDRKFLSGTQQDQPAFEAFVQAYNAARDPNSDGGSRITDAEAANLKALPLPKQLTADDVQALVARWNRSLDYYAQKIFRTTDVPSGQSTDFFALDTLGAEAKAAQDAQAGAAADGYADPFDGLHQAEQAIQDVLNAPDPAGTCATVKIELDQTVTLTRTAFKATLKLDNAPQNVALSNIAVSLKVTDLKGSDASGVFGISAPKTTGFMVDGTGTLQPGAEGVAAFTLLPAHQAAANGDTIYLVSGTLSYTQSGATVTIPLFPVQILVKPDPFLQFHYFLQRDVYGPDPFDGPNVPAKPEEPFSLGLIVKNAGLGTARNFDIATSQPKIVDNEKGLLIAFQLIGTQINSLPVTPALDINLGDIAGGATSVAQFILTASLAGKFIDFTAKYTHVDDLGNPRTSLIDSIDTHLLSHVVRIDSPSDDGKPDFLTDDIPDVNNTPDTVWDSVDASHTHVANAADAAADGQVSDGNQVVHVSFTPPAGGGYVYAQLDDPGAGNYRLASVVRSDGKVIRLGDNAWLTSRVIRLQGQAPFVQNRLYLFDEASTGSYTVTYSPPAPVDANAGALKQRGDGAPVIFGGTGSGGSGSAGGTGTGGTGTGGGGTPTPTQPMVVTAVLSDGSLYAENPDRSSGIRIVPEAGVGTAAEGATVRGTGTLRTATNGERYIDAHSLTTVGTGAISALGLSTKAYFGGDYFYNANTGAGQQGMTGGAGLTSVGLLTATVGKVSAVSAGGFTMTDGYQTPILVALPSGAAAPSVSDFVGVTGIASIVKSGSTLTPFLLARRSSDIADVSTMAQTFTTPDGLLSVGDNLLALPGVPLDPSPAAVLSAYTTGGGSGLYGRLIRYDIPTQTEVGYGPTSPDELFSLLNGEGYRFRINAGEPTTLSFQGLPVNYADRWLPLPVLGAARIGDPFNMAVDWSSVLVNDGTQVVPLQNAAQTQFPPWLNSKAMYFDSATQKSKTLGLPSDSPDSTSLMPWRGYTVLTSKPNGALALIVPATGVPTPTLVSLSPNTALAGGLPFTLTVSGQQFVSGATVLWNGSPRATTFVSATQLTAQITENDIQSVSPVTVTVKNTPAGAVSNGLSFTITAPALSISGLEPATVPAGSPDFALTIHGAGFLSGARVAFKGKPVTPTSVAGNAITFTVHQGDIPAAGAYPVTVDNGPNTTGVSASLLVGAPRLDTLTPGASALHAAGDPPLSLTVAGASFVPGTTVSFDGQTLTPSATSGTSLTVSVPSSLLTTARTVSVFAVNPGGQASNTHPFSLGNAHLTVTEKTTSLGNGSYRVDLTLTNSGATDALNVKIIRATLSSKAGTPIPQTVGTVPAGGAGTASLTFAGATQKSLTFTITYTGGSLSPFYPNP